MNELKPRICPECWKEFTPRNSMQKCDSISCAIAYAKKKQEQKDKREAVAATREKRRNLRERKIALKKRSDWVADVQREFNKFIRLRDADMPCISCGEKNPPMLHGGQWDCGHFLSVGHAPELRFEELNAHKQCKSCNGGAGHYAHKNKTVSQKYRENLIQKIGLPKVEWLEGPHEPKKYTIDQLKELLVLYRSKQREINKQLRAQIEQGE
ncbi:recombination protein NinG [Tolumonas lignilytica]|uniref:recombination protein NinG n=1 Tax=Tolumonas lignilytica TaxID=1283284 RepID=UPI000467EA38|nr:recombination protein NinG [Tolumonas lignilytica]